MPHVGPSRQRRSPTGLTGLAGTLLSAGLAAALLAGCAVGARGALTTEVPTGSDAADEFVRAMPRGDLATFTAEYTVTVPMTGVATTATLAQSGVGKRGVTIGDVRYVFGERGTTQTCTVSTAVCDTGLEIASTSDTGLGPTWASTSVRARVRTDLAAASAPPTVTEAEIAGQAATCLDIPLSPAGAAEPVRSQYCILDNGVIARIDRADVIVELTAYRAEADDALLGVVVPPTTPETTMPAETTTPAAITVPAGTTMPAAEG